MSEDNSQSGTNSTASNTESSLPPLIAGLEPGLTIGNFTLKKRLGRGGMGEVWLAYQASMDRDVALKLLSPVFIQDENFIKRFLKEAKLYGKLEHPHIVSAHDAGMDKNFYYLAMSFVDGEDLDEKLKKEGKIDEKFALNAVLKIAEALKYAWDKHKILHRDIKPSNIMIDKEGVPKLMDMGISKTLTEDSSMTMTGAIVGTPYYISPEQARADKNIDFRADIYSLGATLYHLVTGELPFQAASSMGILSKLISEYPEPPINKNPSLSPGCSMLIEIMMAKKPEERQASWDEVIQDIKTVLDGGIPITPLPENAADHYKGINIHKHSSKKKDKQNLSPIPTSTLAIAASVILLAMVIAGGIIWKFKYKNRNRRNIRPRTDIREYNNSHPSLYSARKEENNKKKKNISLHTPPEKANKNHLITSEISNKTISKNIQPKTGASENRQEDKKNTTKSLQTASLPDTAEDKGMAEAWNFALKYAQKAIKEKKNYDAAIKKFQIFLTDSGAIKYKLFAQDEIDKLIRAKHQAITETMNILYKNVKPYILKHDFETAANMYANYKGPFAKETLLQRKNYAKQCILAPAQMKSFLNKIAEFLLTTNLSYILPMELNDTMNELTFYFPTEIQQLHIALKNIRKFTKKLLAKLESMHGKTIKITLNDNKPREMVIDRVNMVDNTILVFEKGGKKKQTLILNLGQLPENLVNQEMKSLDNLSKIIVRGVYAVRRGDFTTARDFFSKAKFLSVYLIKKTDTLEVRFKENKAKQALMKIVRDAGLSPESLTVTEILDELASRQLSAKSAKILLSGLKKYRKQFADTSFIMTREIKDVMYQLEKNAKASLERAKRGGSVKLLPDQEKSLSNIFNATKEAVDIWAEDPKHKKKRNPESKNKKSHKSENKK